MDDNVSKNNITKRIAKSFTVCALIITLVIIPLSASNCMPDAYFFNFNAVWSCDYEDVKLTVTTNGKYDEIRGKIVVDDVETDLILYFDCSNEIVVAYRANEVDTSRDDWYYDTRSRVFIAHANGYEKAVNFEIIYDYSGRPGEKSLINRNLKLIRKDL